MAARRLIIPLDIHATIPRIVNEPQSETALASVLITANYVVVQQFHHVQVEVANPPRRIVARLLIRKIHAHGTLVDKSVLVVADGVIQNPISGHSHPPVEFYFGNLP
jgi:hypothetical protein